MTLIDHEDEHAPVRHEDTSIPCDYCGTSWYPGELSTLVDGSGRKTRRCVRCQRSANERYAEAVGEPDELEQQRRYGYL